MATFIKLEDSPMFQKQVRFLEQNANELNDRCQKLYKGSQKFMEAIGEAYNGDNIFADSLESFGGGRDDPVSVSLGGPIMSKFITSFRELATYKELLRSQVEHVLVDRLQQFLSVDLQDAKESRCRFDKAIYAYDQAREKFASLKKNTKDEIVSGLEEDLQNSKSVFERSRFNLVNALMNVEARKKHEFLESFSAIMDAHLRYFKLGYELFSEMDPFVQQVLTYAQQSKEHANSEQDRLAERIQEFRTQAELDHSSVSRNLGIPTSSLSNGVGLNSDKTIEAIMRTKGEVQPIKQGYLLKRSVSLRADWKRRFFVLDSHGTLYYYRQRGEKVVGSLSMNSTSTNEVRSGGVFRRFRPRHQRTASFPEDYLVFRSIDLRASTIKIDAEDSDLRLCFRIICPCNTYTLQAESEAERVDWMNKITGVIASLLNSQLEKLNSGKSDEEKHNIPRGIYSDTRLLESSDNEEDNERLHHADSVSMILREVNGNDQCVECGAPDPDWASLNLGVLMCIECSGIHRNLGVHISKVRSITLDVKVWEPAVLDLFKNLGNTYSNSIWERLLQVQNDGDSLPPVTKPSPKDSVHEKEKFINAKYVKKLLLGDTSAELSSSLFLFPQYVKKLLLGDTSAELSTATTRIWEAVKNNNLREVYQLIAISPPSIVNSTYNEVSYDTLSQDTSESASTPDFTKIHSDHTTCLKIKSFRDPGFCLQGCSLLHLACHGVNPVMLELLLQFGANINSCDLHGRTPLQHCISEGNNELAKFLLRRGASVSSKDEGGLTALERAMERGAITDDQLFVLLAGSV
ncbi:hypothetical protein LIER_04023 [Lithospermum erythrorhizon]|uniref:ADP-ribosylation factor GTPase-activating protein AGD4-like n=1 Tax=Lithospermum erythrorhizon TaxID=34254 RepID=A0AAV3NX18_LITER